jgi:putative tryptophan/tyrosine transport system substrate-binding protein
MAIGIERRQFISALGGAAVVWPLVAGAQQTDRVRRIGVLMNKTADDSQGRDEISILVSALQQRGWTLGGNLHIDYRWGAGDANLYRKFAAELVALAPDLLFGVGGTVVGALQQVTHDVPIVFVETTDPVNRGLVASLSQPGGNTTGFTQFEFGISGKWLELLKEIAPGVTRAAVVRDPGQFSGVGELAAIQAVAPALRVDLSPVDARDANAIERTLTEFARQPNGGVIVTPSGAADRNRDRIINVANQHRLPAVYARRYYVIGGGLISYGPDTREPFRLAAGYVDRILKGEKPADLPVQAPTTLELVINLKTAKALNLTIPASVLARANEVIE